MNSMAAARRARLRGTLDEEPPGAREIEHLGRNPDCQLLQGLTLVGISGKTAARVLNVIVREGQSPLAIRAGKMFDEALFGKGAGRVLQLYREAGRLGPTESRIASIPLITGNDKLLARSEATKFLRRKLAGDPTAPNILVKPLLELEIAGVRIGIEPDALVATDDEPFYRIVEAKSYPDRGGKTNPADLRSARRQAAVGVEALRQTADRLGAADAIALVPLVADVVLKVPGSNNATLTTTSVEAEYVSIRRALDAAPGILTEIEQALSQFGAQAAFDDPLVLDALPFNYLPTCREFCALAVSCRGKAQAAAAPVILGVRAQEELAPAGSLSRVFELVNGTGAPPRTLAEQTLQRRLLEVATAYSKVVL